MTTAVGTGTRTVALIGNPNTGKSTLFSALSGVQQRVGNYPGVTVEKKLGTMHHDGVRWTLVDLPGTYSLAPRSPDEMVAVDVLLGRGEDLPHPDAVICVVDASNLERNLYLVSQVRELGRPMVVALTMGDVAAARGLTIDVGRLGERLGVPVVAVQAHRRVGLEALKQALVEVLGGSAPVFESPFPAEFQAEVARLEGVFQAEGGAGAAGLPRYLVERLLLDGGGILEERVLGAGEHAAARGELPGARARLAASGYPVPAVEAMARYGWVAGVVEGVVKRPEVPHESLADRFDAVLTHRVWGSLILAAAMLLMFQAVYSWAQAPMGWIEGGLGWIGERIAGGLPEGALRSLLLDGVIGGVGGILVFLPQILILFFFLGVLEDCGYLARAAYLMDRLMVRAGLSGKSFIPLLSSFACAIPGVMATRVIEDRRDRLATMLVAPLMSCSARLPVYTLLIGAFLPGRYVVGPWRVGTADFGITLGLTLPAVTMLGLYSIGIVVAAGVALLLKRTLLKGATPPFVMELPAYRWPSPGVVLRRMVESGWSFVRRAGTIILAVSIVMWGMLYYPRLSEGERGAFQGERERLEGRLAGAEGVEAEWIQGAIEDLANRENGAQMRQSVLGRLGHGIEPLVRPLGWDWRIGSAVIASFPAREVVVATLGVIFDVGEVEDGGAGERSLTGSLQRATWGESGRKLFTVPVAVSIMVFFALCAQCVSTLAVMRRETGSWGWPAFCFVYMTALAYAGAFLTYQVGTWLGG